jgi:NAD(P)-dependent dehydrogenase (short-subunit alcohol dehydrogenase family)
MNIENSIALVTGANGGRGKAYTDALLEAGAAKVYAGARDPASVAVLPFLLPLSAYSQQASSPILDVQSLMSVREFRGARGPSTESPRRY